MLATVSTNTFLVRMRYALYTNVQDCMGLDFQSLILVHNIHSVSFLEAFIHNKMQRHNNNMAIYGRYLYLTNHKAKQTQQKTKWDKIWYFIIIYYNINDTLIFLFSIAWYIHEHTTDSTQFNQIKSQRKRRSIYFEKS